MKKIKSLIIHGHSRRGELGNATIEVDGQEVDMEGKAEAISKVIQVLRDNSEEEEMA